MDSWIGLVLKWIKILGNPMVSIVLLTTIWICNPTPLLSQSISDTFDISEIPTNLGSYSPSCNGPLTKISITLPSGGSWTVTGIDISYNMTAQAGGFKSHQRSYIRCQNTATSESTVYEGTGNTGGVQVYNRPGVIIANGTYSSNTILSFEMRAWRTTVGAGCNTTYNRVDNFSWIITVHYSQVPDEGSVGIGTTTPSPSAILDLNSNSQALLLPRLSTAQRNAIAFPVDGMVIFNTTTKKLEVYAGGWGTISYTSPGVKKLMGGTADDYCQSISQTNDGGYIIAAYTPSSNTGTLTGLINNGGQDFWILRLDENGNIVWQKLLGGSDSDVAYSIQQTSDNGFIVAGYAGSSNTGTLSGITNHGSYDYWILKLDSNGNIVWQKLLGGNSLDQASSIQQTNDGGFIVAGFSWSSNSGSLIGLTNNGAQDYWIIKLDSIGNIVWQKLLGGSAADYATSIQQTSDGGYIVAGYTLSSNSGTLLGFTNNGNLDYWILKLDASGNIIWQKLFGGSAADHAQSIQQTSDGGYIIAGFTYSSNTGTLLGLTNNGSADYWIIKLDDSGNIIWQKLMGGLGQDDPNSIQQTSDGGYIIAGNSNSSNTGTLIGLVNNGPASTSDYWIVKLDSNGSIAWQKLLGGTGIDQTYSGDQTTDGGFILGGNSTSSNTGNLLGLSSNGGGDIWILKLDAYGNPY